MKNEKKVEYMIFPRIAALSEVLWTSPDKKNWSLFETKIEPLMKRYESWGVTVNPGYFDIGSNVTSTSNKNGVTLSLNCNAKSGQMNWDSPLTGLYQGPVTIQASNLYTAKFIGNDQKVKSTFSQLVEINKATGKDVTLRQQPSRSYPGDGPFTLVNGIRNNTEKNIHFKKYLGYSGENLEATIDLGLETPVKNIKVWFLHQPSSWIHQPSSIEISSSNDGTDFKKMGNSEKLIFEHGSQQIGYIELNINSIQRYIKVLVKNKGTIPAGNPGEGNKSWLFVDEIQIN
jgi:hexosaminidase